MPHRIIAAWKDFAPVAFATVLPPLPQDIEWLQVASWILVAFGAYINIHNKAVVPFWRNTVLPYVKRIRKKKTITRSQRIKKTRI